MKTEIPQLPAIKQQDGSFKVWCKFCRRWHFHGKVGHKVAHCRDSASPYELTGYELIEEDPRAESKR